MQTIFPILRYDDARGAMRSLCATFGFVELFSVPESGPFVRHAQLKLGTNVIMLGSVRPGERFGSPRELGGSTQALCVYVDNLDAHFERARSAGAEIMSPLKETDFGSREYHASDLEGHLWIFGTYLPNADRATIRASGTFEVQLTPQPSDDVTLGRMSIEKQLHGDLDGTSKGEMLTAVTGVQGSAGYVAVERVSGTLHGRSGTFALQHSGTMTRGAPQLTVTVVPDSGSGELAGLGGSMTIDIVDGKHFYEFQYTLLESNPGS